MFIIEFQYDRGNQTGCSPNYYEIFWPCTWRVTWLSRHVPFEGFYQIIGFPNLYDIIAYNSMIKHANVWCSNIVCHCKHVMKNKCPVKLSTTHKMNRPPILILGVYRNIFRISDRRHFRGSKRLERVIAELYCNTGAPTATPTIIKHWSSDCIGMPRGTLNGGIR